MIRTCPRCGKENQAANGTATEACPSCGVVYSKAAVAVARQRAAAEVRERVDSARPPSPGLVLRIIWVLALLSAGAGMIELVITLRYAESAPQQGAGAAMAVALAVIPYCMARAVQLFSRRD